MCSLWKDLSNVHASIYHMTCTYDRTYIYYTFSYHLLDRSINVDFFYFISKLMRSRTLKRYFKNVILLIFYVTRVSLWLIYCWILLCWHVTSPLTSSLAELCFFISLCSHNSEHQTLSRLYWHFTGQDLLSLSYMLRNVSF